ncbi:histidine kinase [Paenibacillus sp. FSL L8-0470]|uniref:sensor histidine kinase n=1 Tax=Paenibacillus sp. FSL L8-0470 TaxID=2954688 RepID=UPI0030F57993
MQLSIKTRLFLNFTLLSSILVVSSASLFYYQSSKDLISRVEETNRQQLYRYQEALDNVIEDMDRISAQVIYSSDIKNYLYEGMNDDSSFQNFSKRQKYEELLRSFNGPWFIASQINIIARDGFFLTYGQNMDTAHDIKNQIQKAEWLGDALNLSGDKLLLPPHVSEWQEDHSVYFSLVRSFNFPNNQPEAVVEIQQPLELLSDTLELGSSEADSATHVYVINDKGEVFYPNSETAASPPAIPRWPGSNTEIMISDGNTKMLWSQMRSDFSGLTVLIEQPKSEVMAPITHLQRITLILAVFGEIVSLIIAYALSERIASPIRYLQKRLEKLNVDNVNTSSVEKLKNITEMSLLYETFEEMKVRLNHSLSDVLQAQKRENVAHLQAMYAQINPHFLFNTLTALASYAEETGFREFTLLTQKLSSMLRYSTNSMADYVTLKQEIHYTVQYMELMEFRYDGQFSFTVDVDPCMEGEQVPKFLLQPLVENSFVHGFKHARPPWMINITVTTSSTEASAWEIRIRDNGSGFTASAYEDTVTLIDELNQGKIRQLDKLSTKGLGHMGIINTLTRCRLFWNSNVSFALSNRNDGMEFTITVRR